MKIGNIEVYGVIYKITNKINGKVYIGKTENKLGFNGRYGNDLYKYTHNEHIRNSIKKYGIENFEIIPEFDTAFSREELYKKEEEYILFYKSYIPKYGFNKTMGGYHNYPTQETVDKRSGANAYNAKKVMNIDTGKIYNTMAEAQRETGIFASSISLSCKSKWFIGLSKTRRAGGYSWATISDFEERKKSEKNRSMQYIEVFGVGH